PEGGAIVKPGAPAPGPVRDLPSAPPQPRRGDTGPAMSPLRGSGTKARQTGRTARAALPELIAEEEERLEGLLAQHLEREESSAFGEPFDAGPDGERLRRYQATCDRTLLRVLETLRKRRRDAEGPATTPRRPARSPRKQ